MWWSSSSEDSYAESDSTKNWPKKILTAVLAAFFDEKETYSVSYAAINDAINTMQGAYNWYKTGYNCDIEYNLSRFRCAYLYRYMTCHVVVTKNLFHILHNNDHIDNVLSAMQARNNVRVCSIGGGPGSDLLGFTLFLTEIGIVREVNVYGTVLDASIAWRKCFRNVANQLVPDDLPTACYVRFNFFARPSFKVQQKIRKANLVTIVKFVSAILDENRQDGFENCRNNLAQLLDYVSPGACVLFVDNSGGPAYYVMQFAAESAGLRKIKQIRSMPMYVSNQECPTINDQILGNRVHTSVQKKTTIAMSFWQKPY